MTAHTTSDNSAIEAAADQRFANARRRFVETAALIANAYDPTIEALWSAHDSACRGLRSEGLAELRRKAPVAVTGHRMPAVERRVTFADTAPHLDEYGPETRPRRTMGERGERAVTCAETQGDCS